MSIAAIIRAMAAAGAPPEAIAIAVEAIEAAHTSATEAVESSRRAARERKQRQRMSRDCHGTERDMAVTVTPTPLETKGFPTPLPKTQNPLPPSPPKGGSFPKTHAKSDGFDRFWEAYPRKVGKGAARKAFDRAVPKLKSADREPLLTLLTALDRVRPTWDDPDFIPHASTWLNEERWDDEPELPPPQTGSPSGDYARSLPMASADSLDAIKARLDAQLGPSA